MKSKRYALMFLFFMSVSLVFSKTSTEYIADGKNFETKKQWCHALGAYFDAMSADENNTTNAGELFDKLAEQIFNGNPGFGEFNVFTLHDEWKNLLVETEKWASDFCTFYINLRGIRFNRGELDYSTKTAEYNATGVTWGRLFKYKCIMGIIQEGYKKAVKNDWHDMVDAFYWPYISVLRVEEGSLVDGVPHFESANSFAFFVPRERSETVPDAYWNPVQRVNTYENSRLSLYDFKFNIVDKKGKVLATSKRWLLGEGDTITFPSVSVDFWDLVDSNEVSVEVSACYLIYGKYDRYDYKIGSIITRTTRCFEDRSFIKDMPEIQIPLSKTTVYNGNEVFFRLNTHFYELDGLPEQSGDLLYWYMNGK